MTRYPRARARLSDEACCPSWRRRIALHLSALRLAFQKEIVRNLTNSGRRLKLQTSLLSWSWQESTPDAIAREMTRPIAPRFFSFQPKDHTGTDLKGGGRETWVLQPCRGGSLRQ